MISDGDQNDPMVEATPSATSKTPRNYAAVKKVSFRHILNPSGPNAGLQPSQATE